VLIDTDVLIWYLKGNENAQKIVSANIPFKISVMTYIELIQGMKNKKELKILQNFVKKWSIEITQINENISSRAMFLVEDFYLSHSMEMGDAIIAATALEKQEILLTANDKHYNFIPLIQVQKFKPK
jgi:predicted nucleic acid-binding protein